MSILREFITYDQIATMLQDAAASVNRLKSELSSVATFWYGNGEVPVPH
jgi:hypothetical protein